MPAPSNPPSLIIESVHESDRARCVAALLVVLSWTPREKEETSDVTERATQQETTPRSSLPTSLSAVCNTNSPQERNYRA
jgi:hypothetical protein